MHHPMSQATRGNPAGVNAYAIVRTCLVLLYVVQAAASVDRATMLRRSCSPLLPHRAHPLRITGIGKVLALPKSRANADAKHSLKLADNQRSAVVRRILAAWGVSTAGIPFDCYYNFESRRVLHLDREEWPHVLSESKHTSREKGLLSFVSKQ